MQMNLSWKMRTQMLYARVQQGAIICVERRASDALRKSRERHAADLKTTIDDGKLRLVGMYRFCRAHFFNSPSSRPI
jgi:hypothetical protein